MHCYRTLTSIIIVARNDGDRVRKTIDGIRDTIKHHKHEIIVIDRGSTDGSCDSLPNDVITVNVGDRTNLSQARRAGVCASAGDVLVFVKPVTHFHLLAFYYLICSARDKRAIVQACTTLPGHPHTTYYGGAMAKKLGEITLRRCLPFLHGVLHSPVYCMQGDIYDQLHGWLEMPGADGYEDYAMTLAAWFAGVPVVVDQRVVVESARILNGDSVNLDFVCQVFFPMTYTPLRTMNTTALDSLRQSVAAGAVRTERHFYREVLERNMPAMSDKAYEGQQAKRESSRSSPMEHCARYPRTRRAVDWMIKKTGRIAGKTVLDIGTREGSLLDYLSKRGAVSPVGIELVADNVAYARKRKRDVRQGDARHLFIQDNSFDVVCSIHSLEHIPNNQCAVDEMVRVLKPGGVILIVVPQENMIPEKPGKFAHNHFYGNAGQVVEQLALTGVIDLTSVRSDIKPLHRNTSEIRVVARKHT